MSAGPSPFSFGTRILGAGAILLFLFLGLGFLLPGTWTARSVRVVAADPSDVYRYLDTPDGWRAWTAWPDSGVVVEGPERGVGARMSWNDFELGDGTFEITEVVPASSVRYRVAVQGGALQTRGTVSLEAVPGGTRVAWSEEGDFGWNPLMGYWALLMDRVQAREMDRSLRTLSERVAGGGGDPIGAADDDTAGGDTAARVPPG